ncbi:MAG: TlpA family protein disulfide reductase [bacterium]
MLLFASCASQKNLEGEQAPDLALRDLEGKSYRLSDLKGKVILLDFWATWCPPCREELPVIEKLHQDFKGKGLLVLGISNEEKGVVEEFVRRNGLTFPILLDEKGEAGRKYKVVAIPRVILIDKKGKIRKDIVGYNPRNEKILRELIEKLMGE